MVEVSLDFLSLFDTLEESILVNCCRLNMIEDGVRSTIDLNDIDRKSMSLQAPWPFEQFRKL